MELCEKGRTAVSLLLLNEKGVVANKSRFELALPVTKNPIGQLMREKSKSAKISCCSAVRTQGVRGRVRTGWRRVNSSSKLLTSFGALMTGRKGGFIFLARRASQSIAC